MTLGRIQNIGLSLSVVVSGCAHIGLPAQSTPTTVSHGSAKYKLTATPYIIGIEPVPDTNTAPLVQQDPGRKLPDKPENVPVAPFEKPPFDRPNPSYDEKPPAAVIEDVLSDNQFHAIAVLFKDGHGIRAKRSSVANSRRAFEISSVVGTDVAALRKVIDDHDVEFAPLYPSTEGMEEADLVAEQLDVFTRNGYRMPNRASWLTLRMRNFSKASAKALVAELNALPQVRVAEVLPNPVPCAVNNTTPPTDPKFPQGDWSHNEYKNTLTTSTNDNAPVEWYWWNRHSVGGAWAYGKGDGVKIAVVDNAFQSNLTTEITYDQTLKRHFFGTSSQDSIVEPDAGSSPLVDGGQTGGVRFYHGTMCAAFAAAKNNSVQLCGVAPNSTVVPLKAYYGDEIIRAIDYARVNGIKILSLSLNISNPSLGNNPENDTAFKDAFLNFYNAGGSLFYAAGNDGVSVSMPTNPGNFTNAIFVGGIDKYNNYMNYGGRIMGDNLWPESGLTT